MPKPPEVVLIGKSLPMAGLLGWLKKENKLQVTHVDLSLPEAAEELKLFAPEVIIFELNETNSPGIVPVRCTHPGTKLIGLFNDRASLLVITGRKESVRTIDDLVRISLE